MRLNTSVGERPGAGAAGLEASPVLAVGAESVVAGSAARENAIGVRATKPRSSENTKLFRICMALNRVRATGLVDRE